MEKVPVELLKNIIRYLSYEDIRTCRLINLLWHSMATEHCRRSFSEEFIIHSEERLFEFNQMIPSTEFLTYTGFEFFYDILASKSAQQQLQEFAEKFGDLVEVLAFTRWVQPLRRDEVRVAHVDKQELIESNIATLLNSAALSIKDLWLDSPVMVRRIGHLQETFPHLTHVNCTYTYNSGGIDNSEYSENNSLMSQLSSRVPKISKFYITNFEGQDITFLKNMPSMLKNLKLMNEKVEVFLDFHIRFSDNEFLTQLMNTPSPKIVQLKIQSKEMKEEDDTAMEFTNNLQEWISLQAQYLQILVLKDETLVGEYSVLEDVISSLPTPSFPCLVELNIQWIDHNEANESAQFRFRPDNLPQLKTVGIRICGLMLFEGIFAQVSKLRVLYDGDADKEAEDKLLATFPDTVTLNLVAVYELVGMVFKFYKLTSLRISIMDNFVLKGSYEDYWSVLTAGSPTTPYDEVCTVTTEPSVDVDMENKGNANNILSFRNLKRLKYLNFELDCPASNVVAALVYLSRSKALCRLKLLRLEFREPTPPLSEFLEELECHHELVCFLHMYPAIDENTQN